MTKLAGCTAFITGGAGGIGIAIAQALAAQHVRVVLADIDESRLLEAKNAVEGAVQTVLLDVVDRDAWSRAKLTTEGQFGPVDLLFNNAGVASDGFTFAEMPPENFDRVVAINLVGVFNGIRTFVPGMLARRSGHIINVSSICGLLGMPKLGAYTASKFGVRGMSDALREEVSAYGVGVTTVCPGLVDTKIAENTRALGCGRQPGLFEGIVQQQNIPAATVAEMIVRAIQDDQDLVVTHAEYRSHVLAAGQQTLAAFDQL